MIAAAAAPLPPRPATPPSVATAATRPDDAPQLAAVSVLACVPDVMREIRRAMRQAAPAGVSVPQFRALIFAQRHPRAAVGELAAHLGVTLPTASVTVARLAREGWLQVDEGTGDRRRRQIVLTPAGQALVNAAWAHTRDQLAGRLAALPPVQLQALGQSLDLLRGLWPQPGPAVPPGLEDPSRSEAELT